MSTYSDYEYPHREQHAQKLDKSTPRAAPSKLTEEQLLLLQQQWSQKTARIRSDQRSMRSARSSVSGVQYSRMNTRPVSSSCAGRAPPSFFDPPTSTLNHNPTPSHFPAENTAAYRDRSFPGFAVARVSGSGYHPSGYATPDLQQQQQQRQQQGLLQPRLIVRRRTDADVGTDGTEQEEDISPVGRLRHRHTGAGALSGRFGTFGGSPFSAAAIDSSTSSNYSSYAPYTPPNSAASTRIARTFSLPGRCSTPSSTASLAGLQYACSGNRTGGNFGAFLHGQGSSSSSRTPSTPNSWTTGRISTPAHSGLQPAFSVASTGSTGLQPAFSTVSNSSTGFRHPGYTPTAAPQASFTTYSGSASVSSGSWTPASSASSAVRTPFIAIAASGAKGRRGSNAGLPPLAPTASGAYSTYSAPGGPAAAAAAAAAAQHQAAGTAYQEDMRSAYSRVSSSGSLTGVPVSIHRYSTAGSLCGEEHGYMASVPELPYTYPSAAAAAAGAAGPMASAPAAAAAAAGSTNSFAQHALYPGSFLPPLETVLTGQSELSEDIGSPRVPPGCIVSIFRALGIRRTPAKPQSPRRKTNGHKSRHSRKTNSHLGREVANCQQQDDVSNRKVMTLGLTSRQDSLANGAAAAAAEPVVPRQPVASRQNSAESVCLQQQPPQQQQQQQQQEEDEDYEQELGYPLAAAGPAAVAAAGVCEPAAAGSGTVMATTVLYNSSPRGIYRYSSPNAGNPHTYVPGYSYSVGGGVPYAPPRISSSNGRRLSNTAAASAAAAASSRAVSAAGAAAAAAIAAATTSAGGLKPLNRVQSIAKDLDPYAPQGFAASDIGSAGYSSNSRTYRTSSTPGTARSYVSNSGSTAAAFGAAASAAAATPRGASVGGYASNLVPVPLHASGNTAGSNESAPRRASRSSNAGSIGGGSSAGSLRPTSYPLQHQQLQYPSAPRSRRCSNAGSVISTISEQHQQQQVPSGYVPRSRRCSNAGSVISPISERMDRTYAEVVSSPRGSYAGSVCSSTGRVGQKVSVAYRATEPRQLQAVTGRGQLAWQPCQPGTTGYLSTQ